MLQLEYVRKLHGLSRAQVAKKSGLAACTIGSYERFQRRPTLATAERVVKTINQLTRAKKPETIDTLFRLHKT